jgi:hypothetical protein
MIHMKTTFNRGCLTGMAVAALMSLSPFAPQANAMVMDSQVFSQFQNSRMVLLTKERTTQKECDDLQRQIDDLNNRRDNSLQGQINDLCKSLDAKHLDLRRIRHDIRDVELKML